MLDRMCDEIQAAQRLACYGVGHEGLMMKALCMRLIHLGLNAHVVGDMTTPPIDRGDILLLSASLREIATVIALMDVAHEAHAKTMVITAQPFGKAPQHGDVVPHLPAQTMANDTGETASLLQIGSLFETAQLIFFDFVSIVLREKLKQSADEMRRQPKNLD